VFITHGVAHSQFLQHQANPRWLHSEFSVAGEPLLLAIAPDDIVMEHGNQRFENGPHPRGTTDDVVIREFCGRLDRFLTGGKWNSEG
jgi:hypothetical protein